MEAEFEDGISDLERNIGSSRLVQRRKGLCRLLRESGVPTGNRAASAAGVVNPVLPSSPETKEIR